MYAYNRKRKCGFGPSTSQATRRSRSGLGPKASSRVVRRRNTRVSMRRRRRTRTPSVAALTRRVAWNRQLLHGQLQVNQQSTTVTDENSLKPTAQYPLLMDATNFSSDTQAGGMPAGVYCNIFKMIPDPTSPGNFIVAQVAGFRRDPFQGLNNGGPSLHTYSNADTVDTGKYFAVGSRYRLKFSVEGAVRVRIQVFGVKTSMIGTSSKFRSLALPTSLDAFSNMCNGNQLPRKLFKVYKDFERVLDPSNNQTSGSNVIIFSFHHNKLCTQYLTNPAVAPTLPSGTLNPSAPSASNASGIHNTAGAEAFNYENIPQGQPLWFLISTDITGPPEQTGPNKCSVQISRTVFWRDHVG